MGDTFLEDPIPDEERIALNRSHAPIQPERLTEEPDMIDAGDLLEDTTTEEENEMARSLTYYAIHFYALHMEPDYNYWEYEPVGRYIKIHTTKPWVLDADWYHTHGIPHEVAVPKLGNPTESEWMPFKAWMMTVARAWFRTPEQVPLNPELFDGIYDRGSINFFRVMKSRIARQKQYAFWQRLAYRRFEAALTHDLTRFPDDGLLFRRRNIVFALMGMNDADIHNNSGLMREFLQFIMSPAVKGAFLEYFQDWLRWHPDQRTPRWNKIQSAMADRSPAAEARRRGKYGLGRLNERQPVPKNDWTHEDHVIRFLMVLYNKGRLQLINSDSIESGDAAGGWQRYFFSEISWVDLEDRYWFGYSLLMLLIMSWQGNTRHPHPRYEEILIPALYEDFERIEGDWVPDINIGMVDMSPSSPWNTSDVNYVPTLNFNEATADGLFHPSEWGSYSQNESDEELDEDGGYAARPLGSAKKN
ncbi:hypothetical protein F5Y06DRAFT_306891 [Hypoxylon sp. FL0890]|nr:hypothetical protein F5Y06DRAFT_306891 [Hypoxylon sp. FL0890]